jgi:hypothetical protein
MRTFFMVAINLIFAVNSFHAQSPGDSSVYNPGIRMLNNAKTLEDYFMCARYFEQQDTQCTDQWLTSYYAGLSYIHAGYQARETATKDSIIDKAQQWIDKAFKIEPGEPEIHLLQAVLYQARL